MTSILRITQLALPIVLGILAIVILGLAGSNIAFVNHHMRDVYTVAYYSYESNKRRRFPLAYIPLDLQLTRVGLLAAAGVLCAIINIAVVILLFKRRSLTMRSDKKRTTFQPSTLVLGLDTFLLVLTLAATIYTWLPHEPETLWTYQLDFAFDEYTGARPFTVGGFDVINWNCELWPFLVGYGRSQVRSQCIQGRSAISLILAVLVLETVTLLLHAWVWRRDTKTVAELEPEDKAPMEEEKY